MAYFTCNPSLCYGASCCKNRAIKPATGLGDLIRLSNHTKKPITDIWKEHGEVILVQMDQKGVFGVHYGLKIPCPYLKDNKCSVYPSRPFGCATFPIDMLDINPSEINLYDPKEFRCLARRELNPHQKEILRKIRYVMGKEAGLEVLFIMNEGIIEVDATTGGNVGQLISEAGIKQSKRDPNLTTEESRRFIFSSTKLLDNLRREEIMEADNFREMLEPAASILHRDALTKRLEGVTPEMMARYENTSRRYLELLRELSAVND